MCARKFKIVKRIGSKPIRNVQKRSLHHQNVHSSCKIVPRQCWKKLNCIEFFLDEIVRRVSHAPLGSLCASEFVIFDK